jgi:CheY-like chemotaxis protein
MRVCSLDGRHEDFLLRETARQCKEMDTPFVKSTRERELLMSRRVVVAVVDDMFFASKIRAVAESLNVGVRFARSAAEALEAAQAEEPSLILADLHARRCDPFALAEQLKADEKTRAVPLLGFFSHVQTELRLRAEQAGYDRVMPRSMFSKRLPEILGGDDMA